MAGATMIRMPALSLTVLGPFEANQDGQPLTRFRTSRVQALLAYLAVEAPSTHGREFLSDLLWPGLLPKSAAENLRQTLYQLRLVIPTVPSKTGATEVPFVLSD